MRALGITRVFDLRSDTEIEKYGAPLPVIEGVEILHTPVFRKDDYSPEVMAKYVRVILSVVIYFQKLHGLYSRFQLYASGKTEV